MHACHNSSRTSRAGMTVVELLIVTAMLVVIAVLIVPQFSSADTIAREGALRDTLRDFRTQINIYKAQHQGIAPAPGPGMDEKVFVAQLTGYTNEAGKVSPGARPDDTYRLGPYLRAIPINPFNGLRSVRLIGPDSFPVTGEGTHGWVYQPSTGQLSADLRGDDEQGVPYFQY